MLIRVLSDIHGNLPALEAVLSDPRGAGCDETLCLGDIVGYGAEPCGCVERVMSGGWPAVAGNHDAGVTGRTGLDWFNTSAAMVIRWTADRLTAGGLSYLSGLPLTADSGRLLLCHSYPPDPESFDYINHPAQARECCRRFPGRVMLTGHTHTPVMWTSRGDMDTSERGLLEETCVLAAGSVGQPRDGDVRAAWLVLDTEAGTYEHCRTPYDIDAAAVRIREAGLPGIFWQRLYEGY